MAEQYGAPRTTGANLMQRSASGTEGAKSAAGRARSTAEIGAVSPENRLQKGLQTVRDHAFKRCQ